MTVFNKSPFLAPKFKYSLISLIVISNFHFEILDIINFVIFAFSVKTYYKGPHVNQN